MEIGIFGQWHFVRIGVLDSGILSIVVMFIGISALAFCLVTFQALAFWVMVFWLLAFQLWRFVRIPNSVHETSELMPPDHMSLGASAVLQSV